MAPAPNPRVLSELGRADAVIYGMGSLYTSIAPALILQGVGECVAARSCPKVRQRRPAVAAVAAAVLRRHVGAANGISWPVEWRLSILAVQP